MRIILSAVLLAVVTIASAITDETLTATAQSLAGTIKGGCIDPIIPAPWCPAKLALYNLTLRNLNEPYPLSTPTDGYQSPYSGSPFDICVYDTARVVNEALCGL